MQSKVSMVVPCYNKAPYIGEMLQSVYDQIWDNIEVILVNDGSTDGTREIIAEWEPKLRARGYEIVVVDQKNQGLPAAVRNGLLRMTGEYFCCPDCDDILDKEYVSIMVEFLELHPEYARVVCDTYGSAWNADCIMGYRKQTVIFDKPTEVPSIHAIEMGLLFRYMNSACMVMTRNDRCMVKKIIEWMPTEPRCSQEAMNVPLSMLGRIAHIHRELYIYRRESRCVPNDNNIANLIQYMREYVYLKEQAIAFLDLDEKQKQKLGVLVKIGSGKGLRHLLQRNSLLDQYDCLPMAEELSMLVNEHFAPSPAIRADKILQRSFEACFRAIENTVLDYKNDFLDFNFTKQPEGRIIAYGVLGRSGRWLLPSLFNTPLKPDMLCDIAAKPDSVLFGMKAERLKFSDLTKDDFVIVLIKDKNAATEVRNLLLNSDVGDFICYLDVLDYLAAYHFPQFENVKTIAGCPAASYRS
jgi:glycosyltransferase involved in cell wall biosynthesis